MIILEKFKATLRERLKSSLMKYYGLHGDLIKIMKSPSPKCYITFLDVTIYSDTLFWSDI